MKALCVYCGSSLGKDPRYERAARELGSLLAERSLTLVYGGGRRGLMGAVADAALAQKGRVIGVIPESLQKKELAHRGLSELKVVKGMHERKALMAELSDAFLALPGGFGTLDEMMEMISWTQLGFQRKPIGFLNTAGFYDPLFQFIRHAEKEGFLHPGMVGALHLDASPQALLERLRDPQSPQGPKDWP